MLRLKSTARGVPKVKNSETVYCRYCAKTGTERDCANSMKKHLVRHMKRVHPELDPKLDQAWELIWTGLGSSRQTSACASPSLRNFFRVVPELPNFPSSSPLTDIPNSCQELKLRSPEAGDKDSKK